MGFTQKKSQDIYSQWNKYKIMGMGSFKRSMNKIFNNSKYSIDKIQDITNIKSKSKINKLIEFIDNILSNMEESYSGKLDSILFKYRGDIYFELDHFTDITWCRYQGFCENFKSEFGLKNEKTKKLLKYLLETHLKAKIHRTISIPRTISLSLNVEPRVEITLNNKKL